METKSKHQIDLSPWKRESLRCKITQQIEACSIIIMMSQNKHTLAIPFENRTLAAVEHTTSGESVQ